MNHALSFGAILFVGKAKRFGPSRPVTVGLCDVVFDQHTQQLIDIVCNLIYRLCEWWLLTVCDQEARFPPAVRSLVLGMPPKSKQPVEVESSSGMESPSNDGTGWSLTLIHLYYSPVKTVSNGLSHVPQLSSRVCAFVYWVGYLMQHVLGSRFLQFRALGNILTRDCVTGW